MHARSSPRTHVKTEQLITLRVERLVVKVDELFIKRGTDTSLR